MAKENHTQYALLGLLTTGCLTGYSIKQMIDNSLNHFWKISYGQIYPTLKLLTEKKWATVEGFSQEGKPDKKTYKITPAGEQALKNWIAQPINEFPVEKNEVLLKLFFSSHQEKEQTAAQLDRYREKLQERYYTYKSIQEMIGHQLSENDNAPYWLLTLDYGLRITQAAIEWCEASQKTLRQ